MSVSINDEVQELLAETRHVLETEGWVKGTLMHEGRHCLVSAMNEAKKRSQSRYSCDVCIFASDLLYSHLHLPMSQWNDAPERTYEDVIQMLKDVEHKAREL